MNRRMNVRATIASSALALLAVVSPAAAEWVTRDFESPLGDRANGIAVAATGDSGFLLVIGCDGERGDRWRGTALVRPPTAGAPLQLEDPVHGPVRRQRVRVTVADGPIVQDSFEIGRPPVGGQLFWVPEPSRFTAGLLAAEKKSATSTLRVELRRANGKLVDLDFPLAGLGAEFAKLSPRCRDWMP